MSNEKEYEKYATGLIVIKSKNSNFNSDFTGTPRRLPDEKGTIYATDKALKYTLRKYLKDQGEKVFAWRRRDEKGRPWDIDENYSYLFDEAELPDNRAQLAENLLDCIDVRLFGVTYAGNVNFSMPGPVQISYGLNRYEGNLHYTNQILSPYRRRDERGGREREQTSIGEEAKALESHYVFDFTLNPNHIIDVVKEMGIDKSLTGKDVENFKKAARQSVSGLDSTSMIGTENELLLYIEYDKPLMIQNLKDFVSIKDKKSGRRELDFGDLDSYLRDLIEEGDSGGSGKFQVEIYYDPYKMSIKGLRGFKETLTFDIRTGGRIKESEKGNK